LTGLSDNFEQLDQPRTRSPVGKMGLILNETAFAIKAIPVEHRIKWVEEAIDIYDPFCVTLPCVEE
jgi:hypothetical protein